MSWRASARRSPLPECLQHRRGAGRDVRLEPAEQVGELANALCAAGRTVIGIDNRVAWIVRDGQLTVLEPPPGAIEGTRAFLAGVLLAMRLGAVRGGSSLTSAPWMPIAVASPPCSGG